MLQRLCVVCAWTGLPKMIRKDYRRLCVYSLNFLDRKVMVYPADSSRSSFLIIDPDAPITVKDINIPYYTKANVVCVKLNTRTLLVQAKQINHDKQCFHGHELRQVRGHSDRFNILSRTVTFNCCDVLNVVYGRICVHWFQLMPITTQHKVRETGACIMLHALIIIACMHVCTIHVHNIVPASWYRIYTYDHVRTCTCNWLVPPPLN